MVGIQEGNNVKEVLPVCAQRVKAQRNCRVPPRAKLEMDATEKVLRLPITSEPVQVSQTHLYLLHNSPARGDQGFGQVLLAQPVKRRAPRQGGKQLKTCNLRAP